MIRDAQSEAIDPIITCDVCVIGSGPAGLSVVSSLQNRKDLNIYLVESGGFDHDVSISDLYKGTIGGRNYYDLDVTRVRRYGGSSNHWGGWCRPLDRSVFFLRPWVESSGWPFGFDEVYAYLDDAQAFLQLGESFYGQNELLNTFEKRGEFSEPPPNFKFSIWNESEPSINLGITTRKTLQESENVTALLKANLVEFELADVNNRVLAIKVKTLSKKEIQLRANFFIVALGGIETPRIFLNSRTINEGVLGACYRNIGRYFSDHYEAIAGKLLLYDTTYVYAPPFVDQIIDRPGRKRIKTGYQTEWQFQEDNNLLDYGLMLYPSNFRRTSRGYRAIRGIGQSVADLDIIGFGEHLGELFADISGSRDAIVGSTTIEKGTPIYLSARGEQVPNYDSYIALTDDVDALGMRRISLNRAYKDIDKMSFKRSTMEFVTQLSKRNIGRFQIVDWLVSDDPQDWGDGVVGAHHHMGTMRMSNHPTDGVVDSDCRMHGVDNLYIAGSSVFPVCGFNNPTLTIVCLGTRLGQHLKGLI